MGITNKVEAVRYVRIPVSLIRQLVMPEYSVYHLVDYGIYEAAKDIFEPMNILNNDAFQKDLIYNFYRTEGSLTDELINCLDELAENNILSVDEYYRGHTIDGEFDPTIEMDCLNDYLSGKVDSESLSFTREYFTAIANEYCRIRAVLHRFGLSGNVGNIIKRHNELLRLVEGNAFAPVGIGFLIDYLSKANSEKDRMRLALLMGILSILGLSKRFSFTSLSLIKCRMFGFSSPKELEKALALKKNQKLKELYYYYTSHRQFDKLRNDLLNSGLVKVWTGYGKRTIIATAHSWENIKFDIAEYIRKKQGFSTQDAAKRQRDELAKLLKGN